MQLRNTWMMEPLKTVSAAILAVGLVFGAAPAIAQQGLFSPAMKVNDSVISGYELEQRTLMLTALNSPGDPKQLAIEQLIDDRLRLEAAERAGIIPEPEDILTGMDEFASRVNLSRDEFIKALASKGISEQTFRDFVTAGVAWRELVSARFAGRANASEAEIDRAISSAQDGGSVRVLLSELIMPAPPGQEKTVRDRAARIAQITSESAFSAEARKYSATATRGNGGRLPWRDLNEYPPVLRPIILGLAPGEVTDPLPIPNAVALFQLRGIEETDYSAPDYAAVEYAMYYLAGGRSAETLAQARVVASKVDRCDDLYGIANGQPDDVLERVTLPPAQIPTDVAIELSKLDQGETSTALTRNNGQTLVLLMMCGRTPVLNESEDRQTVAIGLRNRRITSLADGYLSELRADAYIVRP